MSQDMQEELKRLEAALLEQEESEPDQTEDSEEYEEEYEASEEEYEEEYEDYEDEELEEPYEGPVDIGRSAVYSNVRSDVDLEDYSDAVLDEEPPRSHGLLAGVLVVLTVLFCILIYLFLKNGGYLG